MSAFVAAALFSGAFAAYNATTTVKAVNYTTIECSTPTTFAYGNSTYTVTAATTLTVEDCSCTATPKSPATPPTSAPAVANGGVAAGVGAAAGAVAAVAYLL